MRMNAKYLNFALIITLYRDVRYYLKKQARTSLKSQIKKELYNLQYFSLRNVNKRQFKVFKQQFKIIRTISKYLLSNQIRLIYLLIVLNNFIIRNNTEIDLFQTKDSRE